jgi:hypothetical protein
MAETSTSASHISWPGKQTTSKGRAVVFPKTRLRQNRFYFRVISASLKTLNNVQKTMVHKKAHVL